MTRRPYFADLGPDRGRNGWLRYHEVAGALAVFDAPGQARPAGMAIGGGWTQDPLGGRPIALFELVVGGAKLPGRWGVVRGEFRAWDGPVEWRPRPE